MDVYARLMEQAQGVLIGTEPNTGINIDRIARRLSDLAMIGQTPEGGSNRIVFSPEDRQAKEQLKAWMREAGLAVHEDTIGNVIGRLPGLDPTLPVLITGSHIDTVPNGGHFDGVLGVITGLEVLQSWKEQGFVPKRGVEVIAFSDEEGARFRGGMTGSQVMMGELSKEMLQERRDEQDISFAEAMAADGLDIERIHQSIRQPSEIHAYVELHIEQGKVLERANLPVGIVSGIAGPAWLELEWIGEAGHAGATPMEQRQDALAAASELMVQIERLPRQFSETAVATVGKLSVEPGGINVIPGRVTMVVDVRDIYLESRDQLLAAIKQEAKTIVQKRSLGLTMNETVRVDPVLVSEQLKQRVGNAVERAGLPCMELPSGAGHDAMILGRHVPAAMIFVRCKDGISHNPKEWASLEDIAISCRVLEDTLRQLAD